MTTRILGILAVMFLAACHFGCASLDTLGAQNAAFLARGKPEARCSLDCACDITQTGLPIPVSQRAEWVDQLCRDRQAKLPTINVPVSIGTVAASAPGK